MKEKLRRIATFGLSLLLFLVAIRLVWVGIVHYNNMLEAAIPCVMSMGLSYGLFKHHRWALWTAVAFFLSTALILPIGVFSPFTAGDHLAAGSQPPTIGKTLLWLIPVELFLLGAIYLLDPRKKRS